MSWLRLYTDLLRDAKVMQLGGSLFKTWVLCLCTAKENDGRLPLLNDLAFALRLRKDVCEQHLKALVEAGLIDVQGDEYRPHNWDSRQFVSDDVNARVKAFRDRKRNVSCNVSCNVAGNAHETEMQPLARAQSQSTEYREELPPPPAAGARPSPATTDPQPELHAAVNRIAAFWPNPGRIPYAISAACTEFGHGPPGQSVSAWTAKVEANAMLHADHHRRGRAANNRHFIPTLERWFTDGDYTRDPPEVIQSVTNQPKKQTATDILREKYAKEAAEKARNQNAN